MTEKGRLTNLEIENPVFIGCSASSGSTLLSVLLNRHPEIVCGPELSFYNKKIIYNVGFEYFRSHFWQWVKRGLNTDGFWLYPAFLQNREAYGLGDTDLEYYLKTSRNLKEFSDKLISDILLRAEKRVFAEKTPSNSYCFSEIRQIYPFAKFIHLVRDGRDAFCSLKKRGLHPFVASSEWLYNTSSALVIKDSPNYIEIKYENLVRQPEESMQRVCNHVGVRYDERIFKACDDEFTLKDRLGRKTWRLSPRDVISDQSVGRYKYEMNKYDQAVFFSTELTDVGKRRLNTTVDNVIEAMKETGCHELKMGELEPISVATKVYAELFYIKRMIRSVYRKRGCISRLTRFAKRS